MSEVKVELVDCDAGDWVGIYIDGKLDYEGHNMHTSIWIKLIRTYKFKSINIFTITDDCMEAGLPALFTDIPVGEFIK